MTAEPEPGPEPGPCVALPADRAFLVQFRAGPPRPLPGRGPAREPSGRVEHLASGQSARFGDWAGLRQFIERVLAQDQPDQP